MKFIPLLPLATLACLMGGCALSGDKADGSAAAPAARSEPPVANAIAFSVTPPALRDKAPLAGAAVSGNEVLGLFDFSSKLDVQPGDRQKDSRVFSRQSWAQNLQTALPLPLGSPLQLGVSSQMEQRFTQQGVLAAQQRGLKARWNDGELRFALDASDSSAVTATACGLDASLSAPLPEELRSLSADARDLRLGGQLCQRTLAGGLPQKAQIVSAQTAWDDAFGARRLSISHAVVRDQWLAAGQNTERGAASSGVELGATHAIELAGFSLKQELAVRSAAHGAERSDAGAGWAARSQLSRSVYRVPVTASWQRHDAAVWSLGSTQEAAYETSLGVDLSSQLRQWLSQTAGANLSYHRLDPVDRKASSDDQIRLGVSLGW